MSERRNDPCTNEAKAAKALNRREFLAAAGAVALSTTGWAGAQRSARPSRRIALDDGWQFAEGWAEVQGGGGAAGGAAEVTLPHAPVLFGWHHFDDHAYQKQWTYRRAFRLPPPGAGTRVFVDFEGAASASTVFCNGVRLGEYRGGFTPFSFELTAHVRAGGLNQLAVHLDSTERPDTPPFGYEVDYMTFAGLYRQVSLRVVPATFLDNLHVRTLDVMTEAPRLECDCFVVGAVAPSCRLRVELLDGDRVLAATEQPLSAGPAAAEDPPGPQTTGACHRSEETAADAHRHTVSLAAPAAIKRWDLLTPRLYNVRVSLITGGEAVDELRTRCGFREARFTPEGFTLNGRVVKLRGLNRHQTFPFVGSSAAARMQRRDADILRHGLHCNVVRTSHYPQSRHFLDRCDEIGLLVLEEIPGWQHIGPEAWQDLAVDNVGRMIRRDWNHPSVILWLVRINESHDDDAFYTRTNALAHALDPTRQTGGVRNRQSSHLLEDVFTMNDFDYPLKEPNHPLYLNTEFVGHTYPARPVDNNLVHREHTLRHARIHDQLASSPRFSGGLGWCAFDYNTHAEFGSGDRVCYHGVMDIFREPKPAAGFYRSQCEPEEEVVLEPAFHWANNDEPTEFTMAVICSNCERLELFLREPGAEAWQRLVSAEPDRAQFPHLRYPPFCIPEISRLLSRFAFPWGDLRIDGYLGGKVAVSRTLSGRGAAARLVMAADDDELVADGADATRVALRLVDAFGNRQVLAEGAVALRLEGPADLIGENPFALPGGAGAVWVRARHLPGVARLTARYEGATQTVAIRLKAASGNWW